MLLSQIVEKPVLVRGTQRGVCKGVGLSLKSQAVKYLLCASAQARNDATDFSVPVSAVAEVGEGIELTRLRPVFPKNCVKIFIGRPVYAADGVFLGNVADLEIEDFVAARLFTDRGESYSALSVVACSDAVILKKEAPYPLGQRIPAPLLSFYGDKANGIVTKSVLKSAIAQGGLIRLTMALPPFCGDGEAILRNKRG